MPKFAANLTMMFNEWPFLDRFAVAAAAGFSAVEFLFPYDHAPHVIADRLKRHGLTLALFNLPPGDWPAGERGLAALPSRQREFRESVDTALAYADATGCRTLHAMSAIADSKNPEHLQCYVDAVGWAARRLAEAGVTLVVEPINARDMPGYFLASFDLAEQVIRNLALPNLKLQFDIYHRAIMHGDVTVALRRLMPQVGHIQIASVPSRHEPDQEEINYPFLFGEIDAAGYSGFVGCEYRPRGATVDGLGWLAPYR